MTYSFSITYLPCQQCSAKIHCDECDARVKDALMQIPDLNSANIKIAAKQAVIDCEMDADEIEEILDDLGVFVS